MRDRRRMPRGGVQAEKQLQYVRLIVQGVNNAEACRISGSTERRATGGGMAGRSEIPPGVLVHDAPVKITDRPRNRRYLVGCVWCPPIKRSMTRRLL
jgi:hypothetical protein